MSGNMPICERKRRLDNMCDASYSGGGSSEDMAIIQAAISEMQNDIDEMQNAPTAKINGIDLTGELDSETDLKIPGKITSSGGIVMNGANDADGKYVFTVGNGSDKNVFAVDKNGKIYMNGSTTGVDLNTVVQDISNRYTKTETDSAIATKIAEIIASAPDSFDTLKEIADWIESHADSASAMNSAIKDNTTAITDLQGDMSETNTKIDTVESTMNTKFSAANTSIQKNATAISNANTAFNTFKTTTESNIAGLEQDIADTNAAVEALQTGKIDTTAFATVTTEEFNSLSETEKTAEYYFISEE